MIFDLAAQALAQMKTNLRRSLLALTGVAIGVGVLIALNDVGRLTQLKATSDMAKLGRADVIRVGLGRDDRLVTPKLAHDLAANLGSIRAGAAEAWIGPLTVRLGSGRERRSMVFGVEPGYRELMSLEEDSGRWLTADDGDRAVAVVGSKLADRLARPDRIVLFGQVFKVVGVLKRNPWRQADRSIFIPLEAALKRGLGQAKSGREIKLRAVNLGAMDQTLDQVRRFLVQHGAREGELELRYNAKAAAQVIRMTAMLDRFLIIIGATTILLGGLGIANTILASAAERTREIGIRKAVGASTGHVFQQFLVEAICLGLTGGLAGLALGWVLIRGIGLLTPQLHPAVNPLTAAGAIGLGMVVGVLFSLWPVVRASKLDVVQALRSI